jgi:O-acetyl-ADP-ribose deacetylase
MLEERVKAPILIGHREAEIFTRENFSEHCNRVAEFITRENVKIKKTSQGITLRLVKGDITESNVDAFVNSTNSYLKNPIGRSKSIIKKGGLVIQKECNRIDFVPIGSAVITTAGRLPFKKIIHTVRPRMGEGNEDNNLDNAVIRSLTLASKEGFRSISIPAISSGVRRFPKERCSEILVSESMKFLNDNPHTTLKLIEFCTRNDETFRYFSKQFERI